MLFVIFNNLWIKNYPKLAQNAISNCLKFKLFLEEHASRLTACSNHWLVKLHDSTQNLFSPSVLNDFWHPCIWSASVTKMCVVYVYGGI